MKICLINNLYKPYARGGAETVVNSIYDGIIKRGHNAFVISTIPRFGKKHHGDDSYKISSCYYNLNKMPFFFRLFWHFFDMFDIVSAWKVYNILKKEKPDLVITNNLKGLSFLLPLIIKITKIKHIHILHDVQLLHPSGLIMYGQEEILNKPLSIIYAVITKYLFSFSGKILSPSIWLLNQHLQRGFFKKNETVVVPNPIDISNVSSANNNKRSNVFQFLYVGQLEEHKGVKFLFDTFVDLHDFELKIIGDGSLFLEISAQAKKYPHINIAGRMTKNEVYEAMRNADCLIVPSLCYENSPTVIYEAMSVGLPILGAEIGGITEFLRNIGGFLFNPGDIISLREKIIWIAKNSQSVNNIKNTYIDCIKNYSLDEYFKKIKIFHQ